MLKAALDVVATTEASVPVAVFEYMAATRLLPVRKEFSVKDPAPPLSATVGTRDPLAPYITNSKLPAVGVLGHARVLVVELGE